MTPIDARALAQSGMVALQAGDSAGARKSFEGIVAAGHADASAFLALAYACFAQRDPVAALAAVESVLLLEPRNLRALILKADQLAATGEVRAASSFYQAATNAAPSADQMTADMQRDLARAQAMCDKYAQQFEAYLLERLAGRRSAIGNVSSRFTQSLDILFGKKQIYFQDPRIYYFPELPQIQFYERSDFSWLDRVEAATPYIREELREILKDESAFTPYVEGQMNRPNPAPNGMLNNPDWSAFYLFKNGEILPENAARCPRTMEALAAAPIARVPGRSPSILFSLLRPGARIPPHTGFVNTRLICHLPLIVPPGCGFRVGNDTREWVEGKAWLFDDTIEHEAWNLSDQTRVILLFEIWRPELTREERKMVSAMFESIDAYSGEKQEWGI